MADENENSCDKYDEVKPGKIKIITGSNDFIFSL